MSLPRDPRLLLSLSDSDVDGVAVTQSPGAYLRIAWRDGGAEKRAATSGLDTPSTAAVRVELELSPSVLRPDVFMTLAFSAVERRSAFSCRRLRPFRPTQELEKALPATCPEAENHRPWLASPTASGRHARANPQSARGSRDFGSSISWHRNSALCTSPPLACSPVQLTQNGLVLWSSHGVSGRSCSPPADGLDRRERQQVIF